MDRFLVSHPPHIHVKRSTASLMRDVIIALLPATVVAVVFYGWSLLLVLAVSIASCVLLEWAICKWLMKRAFECPEAAAVTGLLLALSLPYTTPWWVVLIGAVFAIGVAKMTFGGLGQNVFNPASAARVFLLVSFPAYLTHWEIPQGLFGADAVTGATALSLANEGGPQAIANLAEMNWHPLFAYVGGSAGEISALALLVGFGYLLLRKVVKIWIPLSIFVTVAVVSAVFHAIDPVTYTGPVFNLLSGGVILGACFMATDYVTSPMTVPGGIVFGVGIGLLVMMIRYFGAYPEGMSFAILLMNMTVPLLDRWFHQPKFGRE